jgi:hypothetical protein
MLCTAGRLPHEVQLFVGEHGADLVQGVLKRGLQRMKKTDRRPRRACQVYREVKKRAFRFVY